MRAYRIVKERHALTAFSGEASSAYGGRWNRPGTPIVYAAESRALAALEALAHFAGAERRIPFVIYEIEIPDDCVLKLDQGSLPADWRSLDPRAGAQELGSRWQSGGSSVALLVPSAIIARDHCVLLNPEHPDTRRVMVAYPERFRFDQRL
jgi:RES domain-containing protein